MNKKSEELADEFVKNCDPRLDLRGIFIAGWRARGDLDKDIIFGLLKSGQMSMNVSLINQISELDE